MDTGALIVTILGALAVALGALGQRPDLLGGYAPYAELGATVLTAVLSFLTGSRAWTSWRAARRPTP